MATSTSTTKIISTEMQTGTLTEDKLARAIGGSTIRNTAEMPPMVTEIRPISSADVVRVAPVVPVVRVALAVWEDPVVSAVRVALVVSEDPVVSAVQVALVVWEDPVVPAVQAALVVSEDPVVSAVLVVSESPAVPVALERELVQVEAVPQLGHPRAQLAVLALRTKSVTAAHRPDLVPLLAGEDLAAAAAEITREQAAAEAATAWAEAGLVAVEEVAAVAVVAAVVVEDGDKHSMRKNK
jgi:hypothetical protein